MRAFRHVTLAFGFLAFTAAIWCLDAGAFILAAHALGFPMPIAVALLLITALGFATAIPCRRLRRGVPIRGGVVFTQTTAIAYILIAQMLSFAVVHLWGSLALLQYRSGD